jgi:folylpolyglutamate synthase
MAATARTFGTAKPLRSLQLLRTQDGDVDGLNIIHIAGTKGKGSTCAFVDSFLRAYGERAGFPSKTGLYTSPHLIYPEERIRINSKPLERGVFAKYFFEVFEMLSQRDPAVFESKPRFLQLFLLVAFHTFIREGVDAAIFETHHGGEYDATNVIKRPVVTAITSLGMDHVSQLGPSIENIAWHKSGILKPGAAAFSVIQEAHANKVLRQRALDRGVDLHFIQSDSSLPEQGMNLKPDVQRLNCSLALAVARSFLDQRAPSGSPQFDSTDVLTGIHQFSWPGRFQTIIEGVNQWYLDGAHNEMSVTKAADWFIETSGSQGFGS